MKQMPATPEPSRFKLPEPRKQLIWRSSRLPSSKHAVPAPEFSYFLPARIYSTGPISTPPIKKPAYLCRLNCPNLIQDVSSSRPTLTQEKLGSSLFQLSPMAEREGLVATPSYHDHLRCPISSHYVPIVVPRPKADKTEHAVNRITPFSSLLVAQVV